MSQTLVQKTRDFGKRQASRRSQEKNTRATTAIRHMLGLRATPDMETLRSWGEFQRQPSRETLSPVLEQFHRRSGGHFNIIDAACMLSQQRTTCQQDMSTLIQALNRKLQSRRSGKRYLVYQQDEDPMWKRMTEYIRTIKSNQTSEKIWIQHYICIGQAINTYMKTPGDDDAKLHEAKRRIDTFYHEDPWLVAPYKHMDDRDLKDNITQTIIHLNNLFLRPDNHLPDHVVVFRGVRRSFREYNFKMETWHVIKHYISTSRTPRVLDKFIDTHKPNPDYDNDQWRRIGGVVFRILVSKDTPIIYLEGEEKEVLLPPGKLFLYRHIPYQQRRYAQTGNVTVLDAIYNQIS